jgi:hypothetical protein
VTSQARGTHACHAIHLESFSEDQGANLVLRLLDNQSLSADDPERLAAKELSNLVGGSPLFLSQSAGALKTLQMSTIKYVDLCKKSYALWGNAQDGPSSKRESAISATIDRTLQGLPSDAKNLLYVIVFFAPDSISEQLFLRDHDTSSLCILGIDTTGR